MNKKFRAWDKRNGWMDDEVYIDCIGNVYDRPCVTYDTPNIEIELIENYILEQWTGLTDKNGKDIYEGDIINADIFSYSRTVPTMGEIVYDSFFGFFANKNYGGSTGLFKLANIEVIGNIHNDKSLLDNIS